MGEERPTESKEATDMGRALWPVGARTWVLHSGNGLHANPGSHASPLAALGAHQVMQSRRMTTLTWKQNSPRISETWSE